MNKGGTTGRLTSLAASWAVEQAILARVSSWSDREPGALFMAWRSRARACATYRFACLLHRYAMATISMATASSTSRNRDSSFQLSLSPWLWRHMSRPLLGNNNIAPAQSRDRADPLLSCSCGRFGFQR